MTAGQYDRETLILTTAETATADSAAVAAGLSIDSLMGSAGAAVADAVAEIAQGRCSVSVLCGPGNNGGDGYVAARLMAERGFRVSLFAARAPAEDGPAGRAAARARDAGLVPRPLAEFRPSSGDLVVDALYGAGLSRPLAGDEAIAAARSAEAGAAVVAVDVPTGLDGDNGHPAGPCFQARRTVTFFRPKPAHVLWPGRGLCGEILCADIGLTDAHLPPSAGRLAVNDPKVWGGVAPRHAADIHKYRRGHCLVVSGGEFRTGASRLAAQAALRAGSGAVTIAGDQSALRVHAAHVTAIMLQPVEDVSGLEAWIAARRPRAAVFGPAAGLEAHQSRLLEALLACNIPLVVDADGLTLLAARPVPARPAGVREPMVLTPHAAEFARLFPDLARDPAYAALPERLRVSKVEQARAAARLSRAVVVFKGVDTVIAAPDGRAAVGVDAGPELATAGSGDVLSGIVAAHLAQGMPAFEAAASAVWLHSVTGRDIGAGLTAEDLAAAVRPLVRKVAERAGNPGAGSPYFWHLPQ